MTALWRRATAGSALAPWIELIAAYDVTHPVAYRLFLRQLERFSRAPEAYLMAAETIEAGGDPKKAAGLRHRARALPPWPETYRRSRELIALGKPELAVLRLSRAAPPPEDRSIFEDLLNDARFLARGELPARTPSRPDLPVSPSFQVLLERAVSLLQAGKEQAAASFLNAAAILDPLAFARAARLPALRRVILASGVRSFLRVPDFD